MIPINVAACLAGALVLALCVIARLLVVVGELLRENALQEWQICRQRGDLLQNCEQISRLTVRYAQLSETTQQTELRLAQSAAVIRHLNRALILYAAGAGLAVYNQDWSN